MPVLLCSLGTSPAIVPEAFLFPGVTFSAVHVITTETTEIGLIQRWFATRAPTVHLTITRVAGFKDFTNEHDHFRFEEVLYRWLLAYRQVQGPDTSTAESDKPAAAPYICLSGGFKTMSAAVQKAAAVFGCAEIFHVLCNLPQPQQPKTEAEIDAAHSGDHLRFIRLGAESGWPQLRNTSATEHPLEIPLTEGGVRWASAPDTRLRDHLRSIVERAHHIAGAWDQLAHLPFPSLATRSPVQLAWLRESLQPQAAGDEAWLAALPKIELHCHLGGFATHDPALASIRAASATPATLPPLRDRPVPTGWPTPPAPCGLDDYMALGDNNGSRLLRDPGCLRAQCEALYAALVADHVVYAEIRCSPNNYISPDRSAWQVLAEIRAHFQSRMDASAAARPDCTPACHVNLLIIATRRDGGDRSDIARHLALAVTAADQWRTPATCRVVGVDLAGFEHRDTRAALFAIDFEPVHRVGLAVTIHAGENDDAEGIWQAVFKLNARRLGHALSLHGSPDLLRAVADRRIAIEMCPAANLQIKGYPIDHDADTSPATARYPLLDYLRAGVHVTVNTDNLGISAATLTDNLLLAARLCPKLTRLDVLQLQRHAAEGAFLTPAERDLLLARLDRHLART